MSWMGAIMTFAAIPLLAARKPLGWWLALIAGLSVAAAGLPTHFIRPPLAGSRIPGSRSVPADASWRGGRH